MMRHCCIASTASLSVPLAFLGVLAGAPAAHADDKNDEYQFMIDASYALTDDHKWIGVGHLGYFKNDDKNYQTDYAALGVIWKFASWGEAWADLNYYGTDNENLSDGEELRPRVGVKNYFTKSTRFTFYNLARLEYRIRHLDGTAQQDDAFRFRDRLGVVFALTRKQDHPGSVYGVADVEAYYRLNGDGTDRVRLHTGLGVSLSDRVRVELGYYAQFTDQVSGGMQWSDNIYRITVKLARQKGVLARLAHGGEKESNE